MKGSENAHRLWYKQPADHWNEALPVGNGRIGGMIYGGISRERIDLNEDTLWSGVPYAPDGEYSGVYREVREAVLEGRLQEAQKLLEQRFGDALVQMYLPLGTLELDMQHGEDVGEYRRQLRLDTAVHMVDYWADGVHITRNTVVSAPRQVLAVEILSDVPGALSLAVALKGALDCTHSGPVSAVNRGDPAGQGYFIEGNCPICRTSEGSTYNFPEAKYYGTEDSEKGVAYMAGIYVTAQGGRIWQERDRIQVEGAGRVEVYFAVRTSFHGPFCHPVLEGREYREACKRDLVSAAQMGAEAVFAEAVADHRRLYDRTELDLGVSGISGLPTDQRLLRHAQGEEDPALYALLFHYGRYLTIAASREGSQPMNLQGIWNNQLIPPWSSNYTLNINTEMNYWPTLSAGLEECYEPLLRFIRELHMAGKETARQFYGVEGFVSHHASDLWRTAYPSTNHLANSCMWGFFPMSSGWLCSMGMDYYRHTRDRDFLEEFYPILKDSAEFYRSLLMERDGWLLLCPAASPENNYMMRRNGENASQASDRETGEGEEVACSLDITSTMAMAIVRDVFTAVVEAGEALGLAALDISGYRTALPKLYPYSVASDGTLNEWYRERKEWEPHHRHVSHLYGLFPSRQIVADTPKLLEACRKTLEKRGDESTGWSIAWKINLWARLGDGDRALKLLYRYLQPVDAGAERSCKGGSYKSLLCAHPPFQIDGNFGSCNGILEMLVDNSGEEVRLLPALPSAWKSGRLYGYHLSKDRMLDMEWEDGKVSAQKWWTGNDFL